MGVADFYSKLSGQEKKVLYAALGFIVLAVFDFLFLQPVSSKLKNLDHDIVQTKTDIKRDVRFLSYQQKIIKENELYKFYQTDEKKSEEEIIASFLKTIENLGREAEVVVGKLNPGESVPKKGYVQYFANVECNGTLQNIIKFVHKIDTTNNLLKVVKMNVVGKKSSADEVTVMMRISKLIIDDKANGGVEPTAAEIAAISGAALPPASGKEMSATAPNAAASAGGNSQSQSGARGASGDSGPSSRGAAAPDSGNDASGVSGGGGGSGVGGEESGAVGSENGAGGGRSGGGDSAGPTGARAAGGSGGSRGGEAGSSGGAGGDEDGEAGQAGDSSGDGGSGTGGGDDTDPGDANGGAAGTQSAGTSPKAKNEKAKDPKAAKKPPLKINTSQRMKVSGVEELWNSFWGIKPKPVAPPSPKDYKTKADLKPNLWERMLDKK